jgi:hypothetical protein
MLTTATCEEYHSRLARRHCRSYISNETFLRILQLQIYSWFEQQRPQQQQHQQNIPIPRSILYVCTPIHHFTDTLPEVVLSVRRHETGRVLTRYHAPKTGGIFKWFKCDGFSYPSGNAEYRDIIIDQKSNT